jgi:hypothetical protein
MTASAAAAEPSAAARTRVTKESTCRIPGRASAGDGSAFAEGRGRKRIAAQARLDAEAQQQELHVLEQLERIGTEIERAVVEDRVRGEEGRGGTAFAPPDRS